MFISVTTSGLYTLHEGPTRNKIRRQVRKRDFVLTRLILLLTVDSTDSLSKKRNVFRQRDRSPPCRDTCSFPCTAEEVFHAHCISNILAFKRAWRVQTLLRDLRRCSNSSEERVSWANEESPAAKGSRKGSTGHGAGGEQTKFCV